MRKFTLFFMSLFLTVGAMAQEFDANKTYRIKSADGKYMTIGDTNASAYGNVYVTDLDEENGDQKFSFISSSDGKWKIKSANGEYFSNAVGNGAGWNVNATTDEVQAMEIIFEATTNVNEFYLRKDNSSYFKTDAVSDGSSPYLHVYHDGNGSNRVAFTVEENLPKYIVTYNYKQNGVLVGSVEHQVAQGSEYPALASGLYGVTVNGTKPSGTVTKDETYDIDVTIGEMPFEYFESIDAVNNGNGWYNLVMHSNEGGAARYRTYVGAGDATTLAWGEYRTLTNAGDDYYWAFIGNPINGFRVVNKSAEGKILSSNGTANPVLLNEENLQDGYNTTWAISARTSNDGNDWVAAGDWFCLKYRNNWYMNANASNGNVNFWDSDDNGSGILAVKPLEIKAAADVATYFSETAISIPEELRAEVYYATGINEAGYMGLEQITGIVCPETGIVVKKETDSDITFAPEIVSPGTATAPEGNLLKGTTKKTLITKESGKAYYALGLVDGEVGFYNAANGENTGEFYNNAFKAYLEMPAPKESNPAAYYSFRFPGTTGVENVVVENEVKAIYDLTGRRVSEITEAGIYIIGGKKVLVK